MSVAVKPSTRERGLRRALLGSGAFLLVAAGLLLWWRRGDAVFSDLVLAAVAWCF